MEAKSHKAAFPLFAHKDTEVRLPAQYPSEWLEHFRVLFVFLWVFFLKKTTVLQSSF